MEKIINKNAIEEFLKKSYSDSNWNEDFDSFMSEAIQKINSFDGYLLSYENKAGALVFKRSELDSISIGYLWVQPEHRGNKIYLKFLEHFEKDKFYFFYLPKRASLYSSYNYKFLDECNLYVGSNYVTDYILEKQIIF